MELERQNFSLLTDDNKLPVAFTREALQEIQKTIGILKAETGGLLTCKKDRYFIDGFDFDEKARTTSSTYSHTVDWASDICNRNRACGYTTAGIIHSHPAGYTMPSFPDMANCLQFIRFFKRDWLYVPIMMPQPDGNFTLYFYVALADDSKVTLRLLYILKAQGENYYYNDSETYVKTYTTRELDAFYNVDQGYRRNAQRPAASYAPRAQADTAPMAQSSADVSSHKPEPPVSSLTRNLQNDLPAEAKADLEKPNSVNTAAPEGDHPKMVSDNTSAESKSGPGPVPDEKEMRYKLFNRVQSIYPEHVTDKVLVCVGVGGARHLYEDFARNGFNNFILIDGDVVEPQNVATQGILLSDIGKPKAVAAKNSIKNINPYAKVICVSRFLDNEFTDEEFLQYLNMFPDKKATDYLIYGCCDSFEGNKRAASLALNLGIPYIGAGIYEGGALGEIIFTYPGVTASCPRCITEFRYAASESAEGITPAASAGSVNFVTTRINATLGFIGLMLLMYKEAPDSVYNNMLDHVKDRNFVWIRMNPFVAQSSLGIDFFEKRLNSSTAGRYVFMDETLWLPQHPNHPDHGETTCPLCGGVGNLRSLIHKWHDTRLA